MTQKVPPAWIIRSKKLCMGHIGALSLELVDKIGGMLWAWDDGHHLRGRRGGKWVSIASVKEVFARVRALGLPVTEHAVRRISREWGRTRGLIIARDQRLLTEENRRQRNRDRRTDPIHIATERGRRRRRGIRAANKIRETRHQNQHEAGLAQLQIAQAELLRRLDEHDHADN